MLQLRPLETLGSADRDWLKAKHHFAVNGQGNPAHRSLGSLVVWNDDEIAPRSGFPMHSHRDMEIVTYVREGVLQHEDSLTGRGEIRARHVQAITAGRGVHHSEYNDTNEYLRIFQIWLLPRRRGLDPSWATKSLLDMQCGSRFVAIASGFTTDRDALWIEADARVLAATAEKGQSVVYGLTAARYGYLVPARGEVMVNDVRVRERDGIAIAAEPAITVTALEHAEIILVDTA
jgi:redox-sensitive bicupin YhaK (pirin superfamily)